MKITEYVANNKEYELFESVRSECDTTTAIYLTEMREGFVIPFIAHLKKYLAEAAISADQSAKLWADLKASGGGKAAEKSPLDAKQAEQFAKKLPDAENSQPVEGFKEKAAKLIAGVKDQLAQKSLKQLAADGMKNPAVQQIALAAISGAVGVAASAATGGSAPLIGGIVGGLAGVARSKMQGNDWRTAAKDGLKGAALGAAAGAIGGLAGSVASTAVDATAQTMKPTGAVSSTSDFTGADAGTPDAAPAKTSSSEPGTSPEFKTKSNPFGINPDNPPKDVSVGTGSSGDRTFWKNGQMIGSVAANMGPIKMEAIGEALARTFIQIIKEAGEEVSASTEEFIKQALAAGYTKDQIQSVLKKNNFNDTVDDGKAPPVPPQTKPGSSIAQKAGGLAQKAGTAAKAVAGKAVGAVKQAMQKDPDELDKATISKIFTGIAQDAAGEQPSTASNAPASTPANQAAPSEPTQTKPASAAKPADQSGAEQPAKPTAQAAPAAPQAAAPTGPAVPLNKSDLNKIFLNVARAMAG